MLKLKDNFDLKELEKYQLYPVYEVNKRTGETRISEIALDEYYFESLRFIKRKKIFAKICPYKGTWVLKVENTGDIVNLDVLYDLIKADLVEKVWR